MSSPDSSQPSDPSAIQLETVTASQVEDTAASRAESDKKINAEAKITSKYNLELDLAFNNVKPKDWYFVID